MNTVTTYAGHGAGVEPRRASLCARVAGFFARIERARKARRDFESLRGANEHLLADIGLTRGQIDLALAAPFWVNPSDRLVAARQRRGR